MFAASNQLPATLSG